jgi:DME family drug/metabolite transporter
MHKWKIFAILAALCNASIGIFSKNIFSLGVTASQVAFYKCLIAFSLLTILLLLDKKSFKSAILMATTWWKIAICAFFGIFILYFFETSAYSEAMVPTVVFLLLGSSAITTFLLSYFILKERLTICHLFGFLFSIIGLFFVINENGMHVISFGGILAVIAGMGYGLFLSMTKKMQVNTSGLAFLWWFIGFGTLFLFVPFMFQQPSLPSLTSMPSLILLSLIPTIGGYYFTAKALTYGDANQVQLFELSEPVFASLMGFIFIGELLNSAQVLGAIMILVAIFLSSQPPHKLFGFYYNLKNILIKN